MNKEYKNGLKSLRKAIRGHIGEVAKAAGVSIATAYSVLNGKFNNQLVIDKAIEIRDRVERQKAEVIEKTITRISA